MNNFELNPRYLFHLQINWILKIKTEAHCLSGAEILIKQYIILESKSLRFVCKDTLIELRYGKQ